MPELPDLEVFSKNLTDIFGKKKVVAVKLVKQAKTNVSAATLKKAITRAVLKNVSREGKELRFNFGNGHRLGLHLMLKGQLQLSDPKKPPKHTLTVRVRESKKRIDSGIQYDFFHKTSPLSINLVFGLLFSDGHGLAVTDVFRQARLTLDPDDPEVVDALERRMTAAWLKTELKDSKAMIKEWLTDQHNIRGIGNAYADEILWRAGISPFSVAGRIPGPYVKTLAAVIKSVLRDAIRKIRKKSPMHLTGEMRDFLEVHNARKKETSNGEKILKGSVDGRSAYYTKSQRKF